MRKLLSRIALLGTASVIACCLFFVVTLTVSSYKEPQECKIPEEKTIVFLEETLTYCFEDKDRLRRAAKWLCEDRNLWLTRAHQLGNQEIAKELTIDCQNLSNK